MNLEEQKLGFKKAYSHLENKDKLDLITKLLNSEKEIINKSSVIPYIKKNKIYSENVLLSIMSWDNSEIKSMLIAKRNKDLENIKLEILNENVINNLLSQLNREVFNHFYSTFS